MRRFSLSTLLVGAIFCATPAFAQDISGGVDIKSGYVLDDYLYEAGPDPVVQGYLNVALGDTGCNVGVWGSASLGEQIGNEVDLSAECQFNLAENTTVTVTAARYLLLDPGVPDMTAVSTTVTHGRVDINAGVFLWDNLPDGFATSVGYTLPVEQASLRGSLHYATGLGDDDIVFAGARLTVPLRENLSLGVQGYLPLIQSDRDTRSARVVASLSWSF